MRPELRGDDGSGSLLGLAIAGGIAAVAALAVPLYLGLAIRESVGGAADAAALAAADVAAGISPGFPCATASRLAAANGSILGACSVDGRVVTVQVGRSFMGVSLSARATAGPPDAVTN